MEFCGNILNKFTELNFSSENVVEPKQLYIHIEAKTDDNICPCLQKQAKESCDASHLCPQVPSSSWARSISLDPCCHRSLPVTVASPEIPARINTHSRSCTLSRTKSFAVDSAVQ